MSLSELEISIQDINQKMLVQHLNELIQFKLVGKHSFEGYPLHVEYFITGRGKRMLEALTIMQGIGMELMIENGMEDALRENRLL